jgi:hypothetical protein
MPAGLGAARRSAGAPMRAFLAEALSNQIGVRMAADPDADAS